MTTNEARPIRARATEAHGSNAGAGAGTLAVYMKHRRVELGRLEKMDKEKETDEKHAEYQRKLNDNAEKDAARMDKNKRKRMRRKRAASAKSSGDANASSGSDEEAKGPQVSVEESEGLALQELAEAELAAATKTATS